MKTIFIVGNSRSGTTMLSRILGKNQEIFTFRELHFFEQLCANNELLKEISHQTAIELFAHLISLQRDGYLLIKGIDTKYREEAERALKYKQHHSNFDVYTTFLLYETRLNKKSIPCEQTPRNLHYIEDILRYYNQNTRVIAMIRDPRDILLSQKRKWKRRSLGMPELPWHESIRTWINYHPITISLLWISSTRVAQAYKMDERVKLVKYEMLLKHTQDVLNNLCQFIGIKFHTEMVMISLRDSSNKNDAAMQLGIDISRIGQWRLGGLNKAEIYLCQKLTGQLMQELSYEIEPNKLNPISVLFILGYLIMFPIQVIMAFLINIHRMRNPLHAVMLRVGKLFKKASDNGRMPNL